MKQYLTILSLVLSLIACSSKEDQKKISANDLINEQARSGCSMGILEVLKADAPGAEITAESVRVIRGECTGLIPKYENLKDEKTKQSMASKPFEFGCGLSAVATLTKVKGWKYVAKLKENDTLFLEKLKRYCPVPEEKVVLE